MHHPRLEENVLKDQTSHFSTLQNVIINQINMFFVKTKIQFQNNRLEQS